MTACGACVHYKRRHRYPHKFVSAFQLVRRASVGRYARIWPIPEINQSLMASVSAVAASSTGRKSANTKRIRLT